MNNATPKSKKMDSGNVFRCLSKALHHLDKHKVMLILGTPYPAGSLDYRFRIVREEIQAVLERLQRIKALAEEQNLTEILAILREDFDFGHDVE